MHRSIQPQSIDPKRIDTLSAFRTGLQNEIKTKSLKTFDKLKEELSNHLAGKIDLDILSNNLIPKCFDSYYLKGIISYDEFEKLISILYKGMDDKQQLKKDVLYLIYGSYQRIIANFLFQNKIEQNSQVISDLANFFEPRIGSGEYGWLYEFRDINPQLPYLCNALINAGLESNLAVRDLLKVERKLNNHMRYKSDLTLMPDYFSYENLPKILFSKPFVLFQQESDVEGLFSDSNANAVVIALFRKKNYFGTEINAAKVINELCDYAPGFHWRLNDKFKLKEIIGAFIAIIYLKRLADNMSTNNAVKPSLRELIASIGQSAETSTNLNETTQNNLSISCSFTRDPNKRFDSLSFYSSPSAYFSPWIHFVSSNAVHKTLSLYDLMTFDLDWALKTKISDELTRKSLGAYGLSKNPSDLVLGYSSYRYAEDVQIPGLLSFKADTYFESIAPLFHKIETGNQSLQDAMDIYDMCSHIVIFLKGETPDLWHIRIKELLSTQGVRQEDLQQLTNNILNYLTLLFAWERKFHILYPFSGFKSFETLCPVADEKVRPMEFFLNGFAQQVNFLSDELKNSKTDPHEVLTKIKDKFKEISIWLGISEGTFAYKNIADHQDKILKHFAKLLSHHEMKRFTPIVKKLLQMYLVVQVECFVRDIISLHEKAKTLMSIPDSEFQSRTTEIQDLLEKTKSKLTNLGVWLRVLKFNDSDDALIKSQKEIVENFECCLSQHQKKVCVPAVNELYKMHQTLQLKLRNIGIEKDRRVVVKSIQKSSTAFSLTALLKKQESGALNQVLTYKSGIKSVAKPWVKPEIKSDTRKESKEDKAPQLPPKIYDAPKVNKVIKVSEPPVESKSTGSFRILSDFCLDDGIYMQDSSRPSRTR